MSKVTVFPSEDSASLTTVPSHFFMVHFTGTGTVWPSLFHTRNTILAVSSDRILAWPRCHLLPEGPSPQYASPSAAFVSSAWTPRDDVTHTPLLNSCVSPVPSVTDTFTL